MASLVGMGGDEKPRVNSVLNDAAPLPELKTTSRVPVKPELRKQFEGAGLDGVIANAPPDLGLTFPMLWECKTMNDKNWRDTVKKGVAVAKPVYAGQIATYQAYMEPSIPGISDNPALFTAINKDTQEIWSELVPFDGGLAQRMSDRAVRVIRATEVGEQLPRIATEPGYYECKYCAWANRCWSASA